MSHLWSHPQIRGGELMIRGSRMPVAEAVGRIKAGETIEEFCSDMELDLEGMKLAIAEFNEMKKNNHARIK